MSTKRALLILVACLLAGCSGAVRGQSSPTPTGVKAKAVYLVTGQGQLAAADLKAHPEVVVVHTFRELQAQATDTDTSLWIDKDAVQLADSDWLMQAPQKFCPLVVVGYNQALYAFRDTLGIGIGVPISGPQVDWSTIRLEPGFSVWVLQPHTEAESYSAVMQGYDEAPTIEVIFAITDPLARSQPLSSGLSWGLRSLAMPKKTLLAATAVLAFVLGVVWLGGRGYAGTWLPALAQADLPDGKVLQQDLATQNWVFEPVDPANLLALGITQPVLTKDEAIDKVNKQSPNIGKAKGVSGVTANLGLLGKPSLQEAAQAGEKVDPTFLKPRLVWIVTFAGFSSQSAGPVGFPIATSNELDVVVDAMTGEQLMSFVWTR